MTGQGKNELLESFRKGSVRALSRIISQAENADPQVWGTLGELYTSVGKAKRIGITGPPGAGKSTLTGELVKQIRSTGASVAVVAVDPVSPFTGGSLLGDRIRLTEHFNDPKVYIRSLSTRGRLGGLSRATRAAIDACDSFGFDYILVETVGVGQSEIDIVEAVDLTLLVLVPESGDGVQILKAGILEIGDRFVVNKSDRPGADKLFAELQTMCRLAERADTDVVKTSVSDAASLQGLWQTVQTYFTEQKKQIEARRTKSAEFAAVDLVVGMLMPELRNLIGKRLDTLKNPYAVVEKFDLAALKALFHA